MGGGGGGGDRSPHAKICSGSPDDLNYSINHNVHNYDVEVITVVCLSCNFSLSVFIAQT